MAMLAEPRRKQKISHDPRNKFWSNDETKFGKRMMERMGWQNGKGLGANEDGKTSHIKVSLKNNHLGVGCSAGHDDDWIAHQDDFNDILATLNQDHGTNNNKDGGKNDTGEAVESLEEKSKKSKKRVHYKKFTRGKDVSRYGAIDIDCILGTRANKSASSTPQTQSINNSDEDAEEKEDMSHGITTITHNTSIQDYFANKMAKIQKARQSQVCDREHDGSESKDESSEVDVHIECNNKKSKKSKKNKKRKNLNDSHGNQNGETLQPEDKTVPAPVKCLSKKLENKKEKNFDDSEGSICNTDGACQGIKSSSSSDQGKDVEGFPRKKRHRGKATGDVVDTIADCSTQKTSSLGAVIEKSKKRKKSKGIANV